MTMKINYAEIAHRILGKLEGLDVEFSPDLHAFFEQFEHLKLKAGYEPDVFYIGDFLGGHYELYARKSDVKNFRSQLKGGNWWASLDDDECEI